MILIQQKFKKYRDISIISLSVQTTATKAFIYSILK